MTSKHVQQQILNQWADAAYLSDERVEIVLPEWSGRLTKAQALDYLQQLEKFIASTKVMLSSEASETE